jgi:hypothetical protein
MMSRGKMSLAMIKCPLRSMYTKPSRYGTSKSRHMLPELRCKFSVHKKMYWIMASSHSTDEDTHKVYSSFGERDTGIYLGDSIGV